MSARRDICERAIAAYREAHPRKAAQHLAHDLGMSLRQAEYLLSGLHVWPHVNTICAILGPAAAAWVLAPLTEGAVNNPSQIVCPRGRVIEGIGKASWVEASELPRGLGIDHRSVSLHALGAIELDGLLRRVTRDPAALTIDAWSGAVAILSGWSAGPVTLVDRSSDGTEASRLLQSPIQAMLSLRRPAGATLALAEPERDASGEIAPAIAAALQIAGEVTAPGAEAALIDYLGEHGGALRQTAFAVIGSGEGAQLTWLGHDVAGPLGVDPLKVMGRPYASLDASVLPPAVRDRTLQVIEGGRSKVIDQRLQIGRAVFHSQVGLFPTHERGRNKPSTGVIAIPKIVGVYRAAA